MMTFDIAIEAGAWPEDAAALVETALRAAAPACAQTSGEVAVLLTDDAAVRQMNAAFRGLDKPTNVLSFPAAPSAQAAGALGDIAIAFETTEAEARAEDKPFAHHLSHLAVHGLLHLAGHDHEDEAEAEAMEDLERSILARLGIPDPYGDTARGEPS